MPRRVVITVVSAVVGAGIGALVLSLVRGLSEARWQEVDLREGKEPFPMGIFLAVAGAVMGALMGGMMGATLGKAGNEPKNGTAAPPDGNRPDKPRGE